MHRRPSGAGQLAVMVEAGVDGVDSFQVRGKDKDVDAAKPSGLLRATVHLGAQNESDAVEFVQPIADLVQFSPDFGELGGVGKVAGRQQVDALDPGPQRHVLECELRAGPPGVGGVGVQVCNVAHGPILAAMEGLGEHAFSMYCRQAPLRQGDQLVSLHGVTYNQPQ